MRLTSLNLSHPVSHLSANTFPLSERADTRPKATAHTHSKATLSICGYTTRPRRRDIDIRLEDNAHAKKHCRCCRGRVREENMKQGDAGVFVSYLVGGATIGGTVSPLLVSVTSTSSSLPLSLSLSLPLHLSSAPVVCAQQKRERASHSGAAPSRAGESPFPSH